MKISESIKKSLTTISGKRRISHFNAFLKETYSSPDSEFRNVVGEYSPKKLIDQLKLMVAFGKSLCANKGRGWARYYSYNRLQEIDKAFATLADQFEGISKDSSKSAFRGLISSSVESLEILKTLLGPFVDLKFDDAIQNIAQEIVEHRESLQSISDSVSEINKQASAIQKNFDKSEQATLAFENLIKETKGLNRQLESQIESTSQLHERTKTVSNYVESLQSEFEDRFKTLDELENDMLGMRSRIEEEYKLVISKAKDFESVAARLEHVNDQSKNIINQARHALNISQGSGLLESYRELYANSARAREVFPWIVSSIISVTFVAFTTYLNVMNIRDIMPHFLDILQFPVMIAELLLVPVGLFCFFFSVVQIQKKRAIKQKYHSRFAALETYLKLSEHLPYDSPEQMRTASQIMRYLEEDFNPIAIRAMYNPNNQFSSSVPVK